MEGNDLSARGLKSPIQTGTAGDNLSTAFAHMKDIFLQYWKFIVISGVCLSLIDVVLQMIFRKYNISLFNESTTQVLKQVYGDFIGSMLAKTYNNSLRIYCLYPFFILLAAFRFHRFARVSEAFEQLPKRGFIKWIIMTGVNQFVSILGLYIFCGIYIGVVVLIVVLLTLPSITVLTVIGVIFAIAAGIFFFILILACAGILNQIQIFSLFRKVYPIAALKYAISSSFNPSGSRKGGFWGLNLWHFVGVTLLAYLIVMMFGSIVSIFVLVFVAVLPSSVPFAQYLGGVVFVVMYTFVNVISYFFWYTSSAVYVSENMAFGDNHVQEEIIARAGK
ncbi:MAG TPA: hypothetical protein PKK43_11280 [Spirochaetota bacterium]|nr:hypothetical protein [Spirochaetota bacterium]